MTTTMRTIRIRQAAIDRRWQLVWAAWVSGFAVAEWAAVRSGNPKAPLSYFLRHSLGVSYHPIYRRAGQAVAGGTLVWFCAHIWGTLPTELPPIETLID
jgi:hypothetical protein